MATQITPSKQVRRVLLAVLARKPQQSSYWYITLLQASSGIEKLKMGDSPAKKLDFTSEKENLNEVAVKVKGVPEMDFSEFEKPSSDEPTVASTIKKEEAHEPLLQENPQRFVLFPIQHHEVRSSMHV